VVIFSPSRAADWHLHEVEAGGAVECTEREGRAIWPCLVDRPRVGRARAPEPPSCYSYRNMAATFIVDRTAIVQRHLCGVDNIMWSTDYPHHGNDWPYSRKTINEMMIDIGEEERNKIICGNAVRWFHLDA
jgi:hypothetical protein